MNFVQCGSIILAALAVGRLAWGESATNEPSGTNAVPLRLAVELVDGSRVVGTPAVTSVAVQAAYARLDIPLDRIARIAFATNREQAVCTMRNGDQVRGAVMFKALELQTGFGKVAAGVEHIAKIEVMTAGRALAGLPGLILYYSFDNDAKDFVTDQSEKKNNGKLHGTEWTPIGKVGGARAFNGKSDYISIDYDEKTGLVPTDTPISIAVWFKTSAAGRIQPVLLGTHYAGDGRDGYFLPIDMISDTGKIIWGLCIPGTEVIRSRVAVNDGQWHHAVGVWDGRRSSFYLDGVLQGTEPAVGPLVYPHRASFRIGHLENNNAAHARDEFYYFNGLLDEVMIFNRALSQEEIAQIYNSQK